MIVTLTPILPQPSGAGAPGCKATPANWSARRTFRTCGYAARSAIIGLSTAVPTPPFFASGRLGGEQLRHLGGLLETAAQRGLYRIVVLHHSPHSMSFRRGLSDADRLLSTLAGPGAELIIHGHGHRQMHAMLQAGERHIPVFGVPSASASYDDPAKSPGYNLYEVNRAQEGWETRARSFILDEETQQFEQVLDRELVIQVPG